MFISQVDGSRQWIPQDTAGIGPFSHEFRPFPGWNKPEPAGNIYGIWKQYSSRKHTVPGTVLFLIFPVTGITSELVSLLSEIHWSTAVSARKLMETTRIPFSDFFQISPDFFPGHRIFLEFFQDFLGFFALFILPIGFFLDFLKISSVFFPAIGFF